MPLQARMADSVEPSAIPRLYAVAPNGVAAYADGSYVWSPARYRFPRHWSICVTGNLAMAPHARVLDVERFDATPEDVEPYQLRRRELGHTTTVYCSRSTVPEIVKVNPLWRNLLWWIATLDDHFWTPSQLVANIHENYGAVIDPNMIHAIQWAGRGSYDESSIWGNPNWTIT